MHGAGDNIVTYLGVTELDGGLTPGISDINHQLDVLALFVPDSKLDPRVQVVLGTRLLDNIMNVKN